VNDFFDRFVACKRGMLPILQPILPNPFEATAQPAPPAARVPDAETPPRAGADARHVPAAAIARDHAARPAAAATAAAMSPDAAPRDLRNKARPHDTGDGPSAPLASEDARGPAVISGGASSVAVGDAHVAARADSATPRGSNVLSTAASRGTLTREAPAQPVVDGSSSKASLVGPDREDTTRSLASAPSTPYTEKVLPASGGAANAVPPPALHAGSQPTAAASDDDDPRDGASDVRRAARGTAPAALSAAVPRIAAGQVSPPASERAPAVGQPPTGGAPASVSARPAEPSADEDEVRRPGTAAGIRVGAARRRQAAEALDHDAGDTQGGRRQAFGRASLARAMRSITPGMLPGRQAAFRPQAAVEPASRALAARSPAAQAEPPAPVRAGGRNGAKDGAPSPAPGLAGARVELLIERIEVVADRRAVSCPDAPVGDDGPKLSVDAYSRRRETRLR
jgi:hypothetical protein